MKKYFPVEMLGVTARVLFDIRAQLALTMLEKHGLITGKDGIEDSQGRAKIIVMPPAETVKRAFDLAEEFIRACEKRGYIKDCELTEEDAVIYKGQLEHKALQLRYKEISKHTKGKNEKNPTK